MHMPVVVGVILAVIFLVVFSEWFYNTFVGWKEVIIDDQFFSYRVTAAVVFSMLLFFVSFVGMAYVTKCPNEERVGVFERLNCEEYNKIKVLVPKNLFL